MALPEKPDLGWTVRDAQPGHLQVLKSPFLADRYVFLSLLIRSNDAGRCAAYLVEKALQERDFGIRGLAGVASCSDSPSALFMKEAENHILDRTEASELTTLYWRESVNGFIAPSPSPGENYLLFVSSLYHNSLVERPIAALRQAGAVPLAVCAVVERRNRQRPINGVPVFSVIDLSDHTYIHHRQGTKGKSIDNSLMII